MVHSVVTVWDSRNQLRLRENSAGALRQTWNSPANNFRRRDHLRRTQSSPSSCPTIDLVDLRQHCHRNSSRVDSWPQKPACSVVGQNWTRNRVDTSFAPDSRWLKMAKYFFPVWWESWKSCVSSAGAETRQTYCRQKIQHNSMNSAQKLHCWRSCIFRQLVRMLSMSGWPFWDHSRLAGIFSDNQK